MSHAKDQNEQNERISQIVNPLTFILGDLTHIVTFPVCLWMALIFTDFPTGSFDHVQCWKSVNIRGCLSKSESFQRKWVPSVLNIIVQYVIFYTNVFM